MGITGYHDVLFSNAHRMGPKWFIEQVILLPSLFWIRTPPRDPSTVIMVGKPGRSGGYRPGAGRRPGATQIKSNAKSKGIKKATKKKDDDPPDDHSCKKMTSFFLKQPAAGAAAAGNVHATPLPATSARRSGVCCATLCIFAVHLDA